MDLDDTGAFLKIVSRFYSPEFDSRLEGLSQSCPLSPASHYVSSDMSYHNKGKTNLKKVCMSIMLLQKSSKHIQIWPVQFII